MTKNEIKAELRRSACERPVSEVAPEWWWPTVGQYLGPDEKVWQMTHDSMLVFWLIIAEAL